VGRTASTEPQCVYKGALYLTFTRLIFIHKTLVQGAHKTLVQGAHKTLVPGAHKIGAVRTADFHFLNRLLFCFNFETNKARCKVSIGLSDFEPDDGILRILI